MKVGIISDTHNYLSKKTIKYLSECDEIWHAGDIGTIDILNRLEKISYTRAVYGNIDGDLLRREIKEYVVFKIKKIKVLMIHIAGRIESYNSKTRNLIKENKPDLLVCGHSHILKLKGCGWATKGFTSGGFRLYLMFVNCLSVHFWRPP